MERHVDVQSGHLQLLQSTTLASHYSKMLTCGFGVAVTPMVWAVIGDALNRKVNRAAPSCTFTYVDDFFGAGSYSDTSQIQQIVHDTINAVLGPEGLSVKKNVHAQTGSRNPRNLNRLPDRFHAPQRYSHRKKFFVLFSADVEKPQPLTYWQCLESLTNLYSHVLWHAPVRRANNTHDTPRAR